MYAPWLLPQQTWCPGIVLFLLSLFTEFFFLFRAVVVDNHRFRGVSNHAPLPRTYLLCALFTYCARELHFHCSCCPHPVVSFCSTPSNNYIYLPAGPVLWVFGDPMCAGLSPSLSVPRAVSKSGAILFIFGELCGVVFSPLYIPTDRRHWVCVPSVMIPLPSVLPHICLRSSKRELAFGRSGLSEILPFRRGGGALVGSTLSQQALVPQTYTYVNGSPPVTLTLTVKPTRCGTILSLIIFSHPCNFLLNTKYEQPCAYDIISTNSSRCSARLLTSMCR